LRWIQRDPTEKNGRNALNYRTLEETRLDVLAAATAAFYIANSALFDEAVGDGAGGGADGDAEGGDVAALGGDDEMVVGDVDEIGRDRLAGAW